MTSISRQLGRLMTKSAANENAIAVIISDYEDIDKCLQKVIDATNAWRESWVSILSVQLAIVTEYDGIYNPIVGATDTYHGHEPTPTPEIQLRRVQKLRQAYEDLKNEMMDEISQVDLRVLGPAKAAQEYITPLRKTLKNRENKKLDFERYQDRLLTAQKKMRKSEKEIASLAKYEQDLAKAAEDFKHCDFHLRESFPPLLTAVFSILPHLLSAMAMCQNTLLGQYYTILHQYCADEAFPSPPPPMSDVVSAWKNDFQPAMKDVESLTLIARGRAVHVQMQSIENGQPSTGYDRRPSAQNLSAPRNPPSSSSRNSSPGMISNGRASRISSVSTMPTSPEPPSPKREPSPPLMASPYNANLLSPMSYGAPTPQPAYVAHSPAGPNVDYFSRGRQPSSTTLSSVSTPAAGTFAKKKPPPPPPPKKRELHNFVTARYSFDGMSLGDLSFKEGDRIKVIKKTDSKDDWWEGELAGRRGAFPANYCE